MLTTPQSITCPHCWERIEIELDLSVPGQEYVEDCSICCRPIVVSYRCRDGAVEELSATGEST